MVPMRSTENKEVQISLYSSLLYQQEIMINWKENKGNKLMNITLVQINDYIMQRIFALYP